VTYLVCYKNYQYDTRQIETVCLSTKIRDFRDICAEELHKESIYDKAK